MKQATRDSIVYVVGPDMDRDTVRGLTVDDRLLVEMNGIRPAGMECSLVSQECWTVKETTDFAVTLVHPSIRHDLILPFSSIKGDVRGPAVFVIKDKYFADGPLYVILQLINYRMRYGEALKAFRLNFDLGAFDEILAMPEARNAVLERLADKLSKFRLTGWGYRSICRFALRSNVRVTVVDGFRNRDWEQMHKASPETIKRIARELGLIGYLRELSETVQVSDLVYAKPTV